MPRQPMLRLPLFDKKTSASSYGGNTYGAVLGDIAAGFDIAEPITDGYGNQLYPIYIMQESGDVWVLHCKFFQNRRVYYKVLLLVQYTVQLFSTLHSENA